jgi:hypothetical protein
MLRFTGGAYDGVGGGGASVVFDGAAVVVFDGTPVVPGVAVVDASAVVLGAAVVFWPDATTARIAAIAITLPTQPAGISLITYSSKGTISTNSSHADAEPTNASHPQLVHLKPTR